MSIQLAPVAASSASALTIWPRDILLSFSRATTTASFTVSLSVSAFRPANVAGAGFTWCQITEATTGTHFKNFPGDYLQNGSDESWRVNIDRVSMIVDRRGLDDEPGECKMKGQLGVGEWSQRCWGCVPRSKWRKHG